MIVTVAVAVALKRPPRHDATIYVTLDAPTETAARLYACQIASTNPGVVMPVGDEIIAATY